MNCLLEIRSAKWKESKPKFLRKQDNDNANGVEVRIPHNYWSNQTNLLPSLSWCSCVHCSSLFVIRLPSVGKVPYTKAYESETFSFLEYDMLEFVTTWINLSYALGFVSLLHREIELCSRSWNCFERLLRLPKSAKSSKYLLADKPFETEGKKPILRGKNPISLENRKSWYLNSD